MEEIENLVKIWFSVVISLCYCYFLGYVIPHGFKRLVLLIPVICLFLYLPLHLSSLSLCGLTSFFIAWLANFKLLLFAFGKGPLSCHPPLSLLRFLAVASFPIKVQERTQPPKTKKNPLNYAVKALIAAILFQSKYREHVHPKIAPFLNFLLMYTSLELALGLVAGLARFFVALELEPTFNEPYLATSLQDFWSRRWNRMVPNILKPTVYDPVLSLATYVVGRKWASIPGVLGTYLVSAVMHEMVFYHLCHEKPNGELTLFFVIQGFGLVVEIVLKKAFGGKWKLPPLVSWCLTMGLIMVPGLWFFIPALDRCKAFERVTEEVDIFVRLIGKTTRNFKSVI